MNLKPYNRQKQQKTAVSFDTAVFSVSYTHLTLPTTSIV